MVERPRLRSDLHLESLRPDRIVLVDVTGRRELRGELFAMIVPLIDGHHTVAEISETLDAHLTPLDVAHGIDLLSREGLLAETAKHEPPEEMRPMRPAHTGAGLRPTGGNEPRPVVHVNAFGCISADTLIQRLSDAGIAVGDEAEHDLCVLLVDDYLDQAVVDMQQQLWEQRVPWLIVRPDTLKPWIGPLVRPPAPPCGACITARLGANRGAIAPGQHDAGREAGDASLSPAASIALEYVCALLARWSDGDPLAELDGRILTLDTVSRHAQEHALVRRSGCPSCGEDLRPDRLPALIERDCNAVPSGVGSGYRGVPAEHTWRSIRHHVSPLTGIVGRLAPIGAAIGDQVHVYVTGQNIARPGADSSRALCAGKGLTDIEARVGAVCEALERHCGMYRGDEASITSSANALGSAAIDPKTWLLFSDAQYADREAWNRVQGSINWVPQPFDPDRDIEWTPVRSLRDGSVRYVPSQLCWYGHPEATKTGFGRADSSGNAAGNSVDEAIIQGFMELIERDAVALWWYTRSSRPAVDLSSFGRAELSAFEPRYRSLGRRLWVLDLTTDLGVPVVAAVSLPEGGTPREAIMGFGAHFNPAIAVARALTEMNQFLPRAMRPGPRRRSAWLFDEERLDGVGLFPNESTPERKPEDFPGRGHERLADAVLDCVRIAASAGLEVFVLDQRRPEVELAVVKVIAPGLRPMWARFAPGRLYEVPVHLGWQPGVLAESALNPAHLFV